jgi:hypothetical protein
MSKPRIMVPRAVPATWVSSAPLWIAGRDQHMMTAPSATAGGQHKLSTRSGNDGNQPGTTGIAPSRPARPDRPQTDPHSRATAQELAPDQRKRQPPGYFRSWRAMTTRWIWFVPS